VKDWIVTLLIFIIGLILAGAGTYVTMEKNSTTSTIRIEVLDKQVCLLESMLKQQDKRLNISEVRSAKVEEAALAQTRAIESLTSVVSTLAGSQQNIAVALAGMNEKLKNLDERSTSLEGKLDQHMQNSMNIKR